MKTLLTFSFLCFSILGYAQDNQADSLISQIKLKMNAINDYSVNVEVSVDLDFLKMPTSKAQLFYKSPDKFKFHSESFAILPKAGVDFNPQKILKNNYTADIVRNTVLESSELVLVKITPNADSLKFNTAHLLIHKDQLLILELSLSSKDGGNILTKFSYSDQKEYALPSGLNVNFSFSDSVDNQATKSRRTRVPQNFNGTLIIKYLDYKVNKGIDDSVFTDKENN